MVAGERREIGDDGFNDTEASLVDRHTVYCAIEMWRDRDVALLVGPARTKGQEVKVVRGGLYVGERTECLYPKNPRSLPPKRVIWYAV